MTKLSTVPYAHEPGLIARLLGVALEAVNAYGVKLLRIRRIVYHSHLSIAYTLIPTGLVAFHTTSHSSFRFTARSPQRSDRPDQRPARLQESRTIALALAVASLRRRSPHDHEHRERRSAIPSPRPRQAVTSAQRRAGPDAPAPYNAKYLQFTVRYGYSPKSLQYGTLGEYDKCWLNTQGLCTRGLQLYVPTKLCVRRRVACAACRFSSSAVRGLAETAEMLKMDAPFVIAHHPSSTRSPLELSEAHHGGGKRTTCSAASSIAMRL